MAPDADRLRVGLVEQLAELARDVEQPPLRVGHLEGPAGGLELLRHLAQPALGGPALQRDYFGVHGAPPFPLPLSEVRPPFPAMIRQVLVPCARSLPDDSARSRPSAVAIVPPRCTTSSSHSTRPVSRVIARTKLVFSSTVVYAVPAGSVVWTAQPVAESSSVAAKPPCTAPIGL